MDQKQTHSLLDVVQQDIARLEIELARVRDLAAYLSNKLAENEAATASPADVAAETSSSAAAHFSRLKQVDAAEIVLREHGPMRTMAIVDELLRRGYPVGGEAAKKKKRLANSLFSAMRKLPQRFVKCGKGMWNLARTPG